MGCRASREETPEAGVEARLTVLYERAVPLRLRWAARERAHERMRDLARRAPVQLLRRVRWYAEDAKLRELVDALERAKTV
jgi:hypothetical protein